MATVINQHIDTPINDTLRVQLSDGTNFDVLDIATDITPTSVVLIRGTDEIQIAPTGVVIDRNADSQTGEYSVSLPASAIVDAAGAAIELRHDDKLKIMIDVATPDGNALWLRIFDIEDPASIRELMIKLLAPTAVRPTTDSAPAPSLTFGLADGDGDILGAAAVDTFTVNERRLISANGTVTELQSGNAWPDPLTLSPQSGSVIIANSQDQLYDGDSNTVGLLDGDTMIIEVAATAGDVETSALFSIPVIAAPRSNPPRVF